MLAFVFCVAHKEGVKTICCIVLNQSREILRKESAFKMHSKRKIGNFSTLSSSFLCLSITLA
ncbi:hypothetical protein MTR67_026343 [Solanum verrucosum]|uniref:Uncharacterized protein n=1 Tax=Solanum verrucosum TaxID=315347 RepID=A0AAF0R2L9_SOLVR|nr:hypothetical protein MTR67_026343 [Solanum verrucosum]